MGRNPIDNPASEMVRFRVTPKQKLDLEMRALRAGYTLSEYVRKCVEVSDR